MDQAQRLDELIVAAEERGYGKGYEKGRIDGALDAVRGMEAADKAVYGAGAEQVPGLRYLLFDNERRMWWRPAGRGYTSDLVEAGRYSQDEAVRWALQGSLGGLDHATVIVADHGSRS